MYTNHRNTIEVDMKENRDIVVENGGVSSPGALAGKTLRVSIPRASGDR